MGVRILIVDDHEIFRRGLRSLLESRADWAVCGDATDGQEAVDKAKQLQPDVIVLDPKSEFMRYFSESKEEKTQSIQLDNTRL